MTRLGALLLTVLALASAAQAATTVTVGSTLSSPAAQNLTGCGGVDCLVWQTNAGTPVAVAPEDGVVVSWRLISSGGPMTLRILHPNGDGTYTVVRSAATVTAVGGSAAEEFLTNLPIDKGDIVALSNTNSSLFLANAASAFVVNWFQSMSSGPALADGASGTPTSSQSGRELLMNANIVLDEADLAITKSDNPDPVGVGQDLTYLLTVTNGGPRPSKAVTVTDTLPSGVTLKSITPSRGDCSVGANISCALGTLASGASETVAILVTPTAAGTLTNTATVGSGTTDPSAANNTSTSETTVTEQAQQLPAPALSALRLKPAKFRLGRFLPATVAAAKKPPVGTTISFVLDHTAATPVTLRFQRIRAKGRLTAAGSFTRQAAVGLNRIRFGGRLSAKRKLQPGRYRLTATAKAGALKSAPVRKTFRLLKR
jgi:uncharacterized repeat protein (TIGR01451 family)